MVGSPQSSDPSLRACLLQIQTLRRERKGSVIHMILFRGMIFALHAFLARLIYPLSDQKSKQFAVCYSDLLKT